MSNFSSVLLITLISLICFACSIPMSSTSIKAPKVFQLEAIAIEGDTYQMAKKYEQEIRDCIASVSGKLVKLKSSERNITTIPNLNALINKLGKTKSNTVLEVCVNSQGQVLMSRLKETNLKEKEILDEMLMLTFSYGYERVDSAKCLECGDFTFELNF